jgi:hypothetical protein
MSDKERLADRACRGELIPLRVLALSTQSEARHPRIAARSTLKVQQRRKGWHDRSPSLTVERAICRDLEQSASAEMSGLREGAA